LSASVSYRGYEFDDFLDSPIVRALTFRNLFLQRVFIQAGERLPVNLRPLLQISKHSSTKANGFFARGYLEAYLATRDTYFLDQAKKLLEWLCANYSRGYSGHAWGNAFDFASRGGFIAKGKPTVVWTSHISKAFFLAYRVDGDSRYADIVKSSGEFILNDLERHEDSSGVCLAYAPGQLNLVHNANLLGAAALLRAWSLDGDPRKHELARSALTWSISHMEPDGGWRYGVGDQYRWIDNHHTAYVIDCLLEARSYGGDELVPTIVVDKTIGYWMERFFLPDGTPKYYSDRAYPLDIQAASQAIETLARISALDERALPRAHRVLGWSVRNLRRRDGFYMYRRGRLFPIPLVSIHWGQSTMFAALGALLYHASLQGEETSEPSS
jgi:hypothetical protein